MFVCCREGCDGAFAQLRQGQRFCSAECQIKAKNDARTPTGNRPGRPRRVVRTERTPAYPVNAAPVILHLGKRREAPENSDLAQGYNETSFPDQGFLDQPPPRFERPRPHSDHKRTDDLLAKAHSRGGIGAWEIAELAHLRGISPSAPLKEIFRS
jgi:hypothetical protein